MKTVRNIILSAAVLTTLILVSGFTQEEKIINETTETPTQKFQPNQSMNFFVTHGHCSTPFAGHVDRVTVELPPLAYKGNPLEIMKLSFEVDPNTFNVCKGDDLTQRIKTPGLFISETDEKITFRSTNVYTMGLDWYQVNGILSIKGVEKEVKFFVSGIRNPQDIRTSSMILEGQIDLMDWDIDYDKIVNGESNPHPTKWMHLNMRIDLC